MSILSGMIQYKIYAEWKFCGLSPWGPLSIERKLLEAILSKCVLCQLLKYFLVVYLCCTSLLCWYRKQRLSNHWQRVSIPSWIHQCDVFEWSHCYSQPRRPPLVLVSYLFHKQKKISKLGWAAIWQSVCLKLIFNTRKIFDMYRQCHASWHSYSLDCYSYWFALSLPHSIFTPQSKCWQR